MHRIRLRHPWKSEERDAQICWTRGFNWPADNAAGEEVFLAIRPWSAEAEVVLNDNSLKPAPEASRCVVTPLLRDSNQLRIILPNQGNDAEQFPLEVQLEIESESRSIGK